MDFTLPPEVEAIRQRVRRFVDDRLIPLEADAASYDGHENIAPALLAEMRAAARAEGSGRCRCRNPAAAAGSTASAWRPSTRR